MLSVGMQFFIIKSVLAKLCMNLLQFQIPKPIFRAWRYRVAFILKAIVPFAEDRSDHVRYDKSIHNLTNTSLIIKNCIPTDNIGVILQDRAIIITQKDNHEFTGMFGLYF